METKYFVDDKGNYIGAFCGCKPKGKAIEVKSPPPIHAWQKWDGENWLDLTTEQKDELNVTE